MREQRRAPRARAGYHPDQAVAARRWTAPERRVVARGFWGRLVIAVEPLVIALFFAALPVALYLRKQEMAALLAPILGVGSLAFLAYAVVLVVPPARALLGTLGQIYQVDGYIRYRTQPRRDDDVPEYFAAVLDSQQQVLAEWPLRGRPRALDRTGLWPALVEFSGYGIHRIDGRSTGLLPDELPALGIGAHESFAHECSPP